MIKRTGCGYCFRVCFVYRPDEIEVARLKYRGEKIMIATGSVPKKLLIPGVEKVIYYDNQNIFNLKELPERLLIVGGGAQGLEIAQTLNRLGS